MELRAKYTLFAEGCRGHIGKQLIKRFNLDSEADVQHYGIGLKEIWGNRPGQARARPGGAYRWLAAGCDGQGQHRWLVPLPPGKQPGGGLIVDLSYANPYLSPFDEFQRLKHHPVMSQYLEGGKRISYGARAICKGGLNSLPKMVFNGGALIGCDLGTLNFSKIKGSHTAMKSGMLAAEAVADALAAGREGGDLLDGYVSAFRPAGCTRAVRQPQFRPGTAQVRPAAGVLSTMSTRTGSAASCRLPCTTPSQTTPASSWRPTRRSTTRNRTASSASTSSARYSSPAPTMKRNNPAT